MESNSVINEAGISPRMALCLAAITVVGIDGEFKEDELGKLRGLLKTDETAFLKAFNFYNEHRPEICIKIIAACLNAEQKRELYSILYDLAQSDRELAESEKDLLGLFAKAFELDGKYLNSVGKRAKKEYDLSIFG